MARGFVAAVVGMALALGAAGAQADETLTPVKTEGGVVVGHSESKAATVSFKGVPFAAPPVGDLRWAPPHPVAPWTGERDAGVFGPACPQPQRPDGRPNGGGFSGSTSEDCLNLNIYAPKAAKHAPVMVWIYGGANVFGSNAVPSYEGTGFARDGVVLVEVNYRLGALGFFAHPALTKAAKPGEMLANYGLMDQLAALAWVQRNITAFGGDPKNVTVFGESAGGVDILALLTSPAAKGLFQKAAVESGGGWMAEPSLAEAETKGLALARKAGALDTATAADLRALPVEALVANSGGDTGPAVDGKLLPQQAVKAFAKGDFIHLPLIIGSNSYEASLMSAFPIDPGAFLARFPASVKAAYASTGDRDEVVAQTLFTDMVMGAPARWIAASNAAKAPSWLYYFSYVRVAQRARLPGANHASEIPYVFDSQDAIPVYSKEVTAEDRPLAKTMHACWVSFAKIGKPECAGAPIWPTYTPAKDQLMVFGQTVGVQAPPRKDQLDLLDQVEQIRLSRGDAN